ncbi:MAG: type II and III secretion system protein, partial [Lentisphaeria bacterium]|nr:type II and III secretion system protein [Lentisphaeria bacterium]
ATPNLKLTVYALSEIGRAEILSTPRLISKSGTKASIKLVTKSKYPESWDEPDTESSNENTTSISFPVPELSDFIEQGIRLTVTPEVSPDNRTINLDLKPEIISIITESPDSTYNFTYEQGVINNAGERIPSQVTVMPIWMPETNRKEINVKLKVYDGETIMIGGVMQNETSRRLDKLPLFGDIPFLGRLFQNRAEDSTKVNYLIFITARLVNHTGRPVNPLINTATPTFNF